MEEYSIICSKIKKTYGKGSTKVEALRDINLKVKQSELLMLMGPSGSGKTTLLSVIATILKFDSGDCSILNKNINQLSYQEKTIFRGKNIGFVFQSFNLIPTLTTVENVAIPLLIHNITREDSLKRAEEILSKLGLQDKLTKYPKELSGGEQQRVSIARGCIHKPKIILCDEPTSYLDTETGSKVMLILKDLQKENQSTLVVVTHDPRILNYADRIVEIEDGIIKNNHENKKNEK